ncbi:zinc finger protein RFP-like isoform X1 [Pezoporus flaviventris]|uniref:zinc finger protein RFP-like isoform X1 n=1 Tax=Pezoporus flaviventris TaxID=889875 RepID=UPI002AAF4C06|nr:zinc finger protein RFP-like isoform X1 [Pezoporus flaviventris]
MSAPSPSTALPSEASCPICLEYFRDPVSIHCGHNFCRVCISRCWEWSTAPFSCPRCRETAPERTLHPSRELARVLEAARRLRAQAAEGDTGQGERCERHQEPLKLFCEDDGTFICVICRESRAHRSHRMLPAQDAVQGYKGQIQARLQALKEEKDKLLGVREAEMRRNWEYLEKTTAERQRVLSKLEGLRLFLEDHAQHLLAQLGDLEQDIEKLQEENVTSLTKEISRLDSFIQEMEEKSQQPTNRFLQDIRGTLSRLEIESFQQPPLLLAELEKRISHFRDRNTALEETLRSFQDILMFELPEKMKVTLDPSTAHPQLVVSSDGRSVRWDNDAHQDPCAEGLGTDPCVLGSEGITVGRCCWEVEVAPRGSWAVGVATQSLRRREEAAEGPGMELWSMGLCEGQFWALTSLERIPLYQVQVPTRVQVSLDYDRGQVAFFDADKRSLIFTFPAASFKGESIHPWFLVWGEGAHITLCP